MSKTLNSEKIAEANKEFDSYPIRKFEIDERFVFLIEHIEPKYLLGQEIDKKTCKPVKKWKVLLSQSMQTQCNTFELKPRDIILINYLGQKETINGNMQYSAIIYKFMNDRWLSTKKLNAQIENEEKIESEAVKTEKSTKTK